MTAPAPTATSTPTPTPPASPIPPNLQPELPGEQSRKLETEARESLAAAERMLSQVGDNGDAQRQDRIAIVRGLVQQSRVALNEGDWPRASTLARKAQVIGRDLARD